MVLLVLSLPFINAVQMANAAPSGYRITFTAGDKHYDYLVTDPQATAATLRITNTTDRQVEIQDFRVTVINKTGFLEQLNASKLIKWCLYWTLPENQSYYRLLATSNGHHYYDIVTMVNPLLPHAGSATDGTGLDVSDLFPVKDTAASRAELGGLIESIKQGPGYDASKDTADTDAYLEEYLRDRRASQDMMTGLGLTGTAGPLTASDLPVGGTAQTYQWKGLTFVNSTNTSEIRYAHPDYGTYGVTKNDLWKTINGTENFSALRIHQYLFQLMASAAIVIVIAIIAAIVYAIPNLAATVLWVITTIILGLVLVLAGILTHLFPLSKMLKHLFDVIMALTEGIATTLAWIVLAITGVVIVLYGGYAIRKAMTDEQDGVWVVTGPWYMRTGGHTMMNLQDVPDP